MQLKEVMELIQLRPFVIRAVALIRELETSMVLSEKIRVRHTIERSPCAVQYIISLLSAYGLDADIIDRCNNYTVSDEELADKVVRFLTSDGTHTVAIAIALQSIASRN